MGAIGSVGYWFAALSAVFILNHLAADFLLHTTWMFEGKERVSGWVPGLAAHSAVHAALTGAIVLAVAPALWWLAIVDFVVHAAIDRGKVVLGRRLALPPFVGRWWWVFGTDQALHQMTHLAYVIMLVIWRFT